MNITEGARIRDMARTAKARLAAERSEQMQHDLNEFHARYICEIQKKIEDVAAKGGTSCEIDFASRAALELATREFSGLDFVAIQVHCMDCGDRSCYCEEWSLNVMWE